MEPARYDMVRYLAAKRSVDDRALHRGVLDALRDELRTAAGNPLRVLELGAGLGSMVTRLWQLGIVRDARYTLLDRDGESLREAARRLHAWGASVGDAHVEPGCLRVQGAAGTLEVRFVHAELFGWLRD